MKYLFLALGGFIFVNSLKAYQGYGQQILDGRIGGLIAVVVFLLVQGFELKPIWLTKGQAGIFANLNKVTGGRQADFAMVDPEELLDASLWAWVGYGVDFVAGLMVWPPVPSWALVTVGGVTLGDIRWNAVFSIILCVFGLQFCVQQYLARGGKVPNLFGGKGNGRRG